MPRAFPLASPKKEKIVLYKPWLLVTLQQAKNDDDDEEGGKRIWAFLLPVDSMQMHFSRHSYCPDSSLFCTLPLSQRSSVFLKNF
jgi:hypothetical protein